MKSRFSPFLFLLSAGLAQASITPVNFGFEDSTAVFPSGWTITGTVTQVAGLGTSKAASLAPASSAHQDFAASTADGRVDFTTKFSWQLAGTGALTNDTTRLRLRGNNNSTDLITLRLAASGLQQFSGTWSNTFSPSFTPQLGVRYDITVVVGNLDGDPEKEYQISLFDGTNTFTSAILNGWHSGANTIAANTTAGTACQTIRFESGTGNTLIVDNVTITPPNILVVNPDFESQPFPYGWTTTAGSISLAGLNGSTTAVRLPYNTLATLSQTLTASTSDFTTDVSFQIAGTDREQAFRATLLCAGSQTIDIRTTTGGILQVNEAGTWKSLLRLTDSATFPVTANQTIKLRICGHQFGTEDANYDIAWSDPNGQTYTHAAIGLTAFASPAAYTSSLDEIAFSHNVLLGNSFSVDDAQVVDYAYSIPSADYSLVPAAPPAADKVVRISGVYPHLTMTNTHDECGVGAVVPWAGKLWVMTYGPHLPNGSTDKLYEIAPDLSRVIRPESIGGTPANRFIHSPSNQLNIGPYFIDANRNVRTIPYATMPGRHTATAAHLTDPNRLYIFTMEDGVYDINATDLSIITRYPDVQGKGDRFLFGYHGKGAYTSQGLLAVANNGRPNSQDTPTGPAGVLATWDGTTVAQNGNAYYSSPHPYYDPNNTAEENTVNPVTAQPNYLAGWHQISKTQHCEVTGPGGIYGNPNPATDPIWSTGFDAKSVLLHVMENQQWQLWRLPKGSYSHDGSHGWHTEWPRIRQLDPSNPSSMYLMHMHGIFYNFPKTFSAANFANLNPISGYYKMPTDYAMFGGQIVMGKNDASKFANTLALKDQSNLWFGQMADIENWSSPTGHGSVWMNEAISNGQASDPFLISGFPQRTLHLRNNGTSAVDIAIQTSQGSPSWTTAQTISVPAGTYTPTLLNAIQAPWVRLVCSGSSTNFTAFFHLHSPYQHTTPASLAGDEFAALADIRDTKSVSDGIIRVRNNADLSLEFASSRTSAQGAFSSHRYHLIGGPIELNDVVDASAEAAMRSAGATTKQFGSDAASAWIDSGGTRFRLPKLDPLYDAPFAAGWARGVREAVTERELLNCHGTFYEVPRSNSGGYRKMRALASHGKRITDFASWRGLFVLTGVLDDAPASDKLVKNSDGSAALWLGEIDDLWRMGEPRGIGGPWLNTSVAANTASNPYLMYGYDQKELTLQAASNCTITVEVDFLADNTWSVYQSFPLTANQSVTHTFPTGFHAHWVRVKCSVATTASAQFTYGPATVRDTFLDWARDNGMATGSGRNALFPTDHDQDGHPAMTEFYFGNNPQVPDAGPRTSASIPSGQPPTITYKFRRIRNHGDLSHVVETSPDLAAAHWTPHPDLVPTVVEAESDLNAEMLEYTIPSDNADSQFVRLRIFTE